MSKIAIEAAEGAQRPLGQAPGLGDKDLPGSYLVAVLGYGRVTAIEAKSLWDAALCGAQRAHTEWAWEVEWPLTFVITRPDLRTFSVGVEREMIPGFCLTSSREVK